MGGLTNDMMQYVAPCDSRACRNGGLVRKTVDKHGRKRVAARRSIPGTHILLFQAGDRTKLRQSAAYPRGFGEAVGALIPPRGEYPAPPSTIAVEAYTGEDDLGALDDLLKGRGSTWWRSL